VLLPFELALLISSHTPLTFISSEILRHVSLFSVVALFWLSPGSRPSSAIGLIRHHIKLDLSTRLFNTDATTTDILEDGLAILPNLRKSNPLVRDFLPRPQRHFERAAVPRIATRIKGRVTWPKMNSDLDRLWNKWSSAEPALAGPRPSWLTMEPRYLVKSRDSSDEPLMIRSS
jgi:hypothetical protein